MNYQKKLWWLIGISVLAKIFISFFLELGNDEVYYYTYALQPDWNHFDHPPMVGWLIRIFTFNLYWLSDLSMRLGSIVCAALTTIVIFESGSLLKNEKAGWIAALLYTLSMKYQKKSLSVNTVSDHLLGGIQMTSKERETGLNAMIEFVLESI